jgi:hypothetical protein
MELILLSIVGTMTLLVVQCIEIVQSGAETSALLPDLIEALAPLGMPDVQYAWRRGCGGHRVMRTRAATYVGVSLAHSIVINVAAVLVIHLAAIMYVLLPVGTV